MSELVDDGRPLKLFVEADWVETVDVLGDRILDLEAAGNALVRAVSLAMQTHPGGVQEVDATHRITIRYEDWLAIAKAVHIWRELIAEALG